VIVRPDGRVEAGIAERRTNVILDQPAGLVRVNVHGRHTGLAVQGLVLDGDGINGDAERLVSLEVLDKVLSVLVNIGMVQVVVHRGALDDAVQLHPSRGTPHGSEHRQIRLQGLHPGKQFGHGGAPVAEIEG
jgi:hypothetical protein